MADAIEVDLADRTAAEAAFAEITTKHPVTALVKNLGIVRPALFDDVAIDDFESVLYLNARTALIAAKALVPVMRKQGDGRIVMITSRFTHWAMRRAASTALQKVPCNQWRALGP